MKEEESKPPTTSTGKVNGKMETTSKGESGKSGGESHKNANQGVGAFSSREPQEGILRKKGLSGNNNNHNVDKEDYQNEVRGSHTKNQSPTNIVKEPKILSVVGALPSSNQDADDAVAKKGLRQNRSSARKETTAGGMKLPPPVQPEIETPQRGLRVANECRRRKEEEAVVSTSSYARPIVKGLRRKDNEERSVSRSTNPSRVGNHLGNPMSSGEEEPEFSAVTPPLDNSMLAEAMPVAEEDTPADDNDLEEAQQVDLDAIKDARAERDSKFKRYIGLLIFTITVLAGAILTGTLVGRRNSGPTSIITEDPTLVPSMAPTTTTNFPSESQTGVLDSILELLPESTIAHIFNASTRALRISSPQSEAWHWLASHPMAPIMEDWQKIQLFAMATFYFSFQGDRWDLEDGDLTSTWLNTSISECHWEILSKPGGWGSGGLHLPPPEEKGQYAEFQQPEELYDENFTFCNEKGNLTYLWLDNFAGPRPRLARTLNFAGLKPRIPEEILLLSSLSHIFLFGKYINATVSELIPSELGLLTNLTQIRLDYNDLHSTIPTHIGLLSSLEVLDLGGNDITGWVPSQIGLLSGLSKAHFHRNRLSGTLPSQVGLLSELWRLSLRDNELVGSIPTEVGQLGALKDFWIHRNLFNFIPSQLGLVSTLRRMYAGYNLISGRIPTELGLLSSLEVLHLHKNYMTGTMPTELGALSPQKMERLSLGGNLLNGPIPTEMSKLASLNYLYLYNNEFSGSLPSEFGLFQNMNYLLLNHNLLSGSLPTEMDSVWFLSLHHNRLTGSFPSQVGVFQGLYLLLDNNLLSGSLPTEISQFSFRWLDLQNNRLSGKVPDWSLAPPGRWHGLELNLANNDLSGPIPNGTLDSLDLFDIRNTSLTGTIPDEYCNIWRLSFDCSAFLCGCSCSCDTA